MATSSVECGGPPSAPPRLFGAADPTVTGVAGLGVWVEVAGPLLRVVITGPADVWFAVGLNATTMAGTPYAIVVDGDGNVTERALGLHLPGILLPPTLTVESSAVHASRRTVTVSRPIDETPTFRLSVAALRAKAELSIIAATGSTKTFGYHAAKGSSQIPMFAIDEPTCVCTGAATQPFGQSSGYLRYTPPAGEPGSPGSSVAGANFTQLAWSGKHCLPYPASTMLLGKGNPSCDLRAYTGGQSCCHHLFTLLDKDQQTPWVDQPLEYHMKFRIYYQDSPSIKNVIQHNWGGMATPTEYDVPKCSEGIEGCSREGGQWVHRMNGTWTVGEMTGGKGIEFVTIHGHCHAPTCIDFTLYNADTGEVICRQVPVYGQSNTTYDEKGYLAVPPCVFGSPEDGLLRSPVLNASTRLFSTKTCSANDGHHGEMSLWQTYCQY